MTLNELMEKILEILPDAQIGEDFDGQLKIYTGLKVAENVQDIPADYALVKFEEKE